MKQSPTADDTNTKRTKGWELEVMRQRIAEADKRRRECKQAGPE